MFMTPHNACSFDGFSIALYDAVISPNLKPGACIKVVPIDLNRSVRG